MDGGWGSRGPGQGTGCRQQGHSGVSGWGLAGQVVTGVTGGHTHHRTHVSCFSFLPRGAWQALCRFRKHSPR